MKPNLEAWPALPLAAWSDTYATLHMWMQVIGKVRLAQAPLVNHWWNVVFYVSARGLTTSAMPYANGSFEIEFDFIDHKLRVHTSAGTERTLPLAPRSVAAFYGEVRQTLHDLGIAVRMWPVPVEVPEPIPFAQDERHHAYDREYAHRLWRILVQTQAVFETFRSQFIGKCSPVHFFWGSFDLAVTRFSGRRAPAREGADSITREAYSHEVISHGFWPGSGNVQFPAFYSYTAPEPAGLPQAAVRPPTTYYNPETSGFILHYDDVRLAADPERVLSEFLQSTYEAGAGLLQWDRAALERTASPSSQ